MVRVASLSPRFLAVLGGVPQSGPILGSPSAPVTATLYGDLECPICRSFVLGGPFAELIEKYVRPGKLRIIYRSLQTATGYGPNSSWWVPQQVAALAAGRQHLFWQFTMLFLHDLPRGVDETFIERVARDVPGLQFARWKRDRDLDWLAQEVREDGRVAATLGINATPTIVFGGPHGRSATVVGPQTFAQLERAYAKAS